MTISVTTWAAAGVGLALVTLLGAQTVRLSNEKAGRAADALTYANERTKAATAHAEDIEKQRVIFEQRIEVQNATIKLATAAAEAARTDAVDARNARDSVRKSTGKLVADARAAGWRAGSSTGGAATPDPLDLLADLFGRADQRSGELAEYADRARIAGQACERSYQSLTTAP